MGARDDPMTDKQRAWIARLRHIAEKRGVINEYIDWLNDQDWDRELQRTKAEAGACIAKLQELTKVGYKPPRRLQEAAEKLAEIFGAHVSPWCHDSDHRTCAREGRAWAEVHPRGMSDDDELPVLGQGPAFTSYVCECSCHDEEAPF